MLKYSSDQIKHKVIVEINKFNMLENGDNIVIGVSGGCDSMVLLHIVKNLAKHYNFNIIVCHINHNLRGEEAVRDEKFVCDYCQRHNLTFKCLSVDVVEIAKRNKQSFEECARNIRYDFFKKMAELYNAKIATAHTLSDSIETVVFNMTRGTALSGLCGINPVRDNIVRPLISLSRAEIEAYAKQNSINFVTDSSNNDTTYTRNMIRHKIVPLLYELNPSLDDAFYRMVSANYQDNKHLKKQTNIAYNKALGNGKLNVKTLLELDVNIRSRVVVKLLKDNHIYTDALHIKMITDALESKNAKIQLNKEAYAVINKKHLYVCFNDKTVDYFEQKLEIGENSVFQGKSLNCILINVEDFVKNSKLDKKVLKNAVDYDKIKGSILVRQKIDGDFISLSYRKCTKSLKKLFVEEKLSLDDKKSLFVVCDNESIVWVENFGLDKRVAVDENTKNVLVFDVVIK